MMARDRKVSLLARCSTVALASSVAMALGATLIAQAPAAGAALPAAVKKAFEQSYPSAAISATTETSENNQPRFRIDSMDNGRRRVLLYDAAGTAIEVAEDVQEKELPKPVADALHSHRRAIFVSAMKVTRGGKVEYRLTARGSRKTSMVAQPDGTVLSWK